MTSNSCAIRISLFIMMFIALALGSANQATPAQAAVPTYTNVEYLILVFVPKRPVCVGGDYPVKVRISKLYESVTSQGETDWKSSRAVALNAQKVNGSVQDPDIGTLTPSEILTGWDLDSPGEALFNFHANQTGTTQLNFKIDIRDYDKNGPIFKNAVAGERIKVVHCKYKVTIISNFGASYPNLTGVVIGIAEGEMKADKNGNLNGTASAKWDVHWFSKCSTHTTTVSASPDVKLSGSLSQDGSSLTVHATYQPFMVSNTNTATCYGKGGSYNTSTFPAPSIDITLPSAGGGATKPQTVQWEQVNIQGSAVISVVPIEDK